MAVILHKVYKGKEKSLKYDHFAKCYRKAKQRLRFIVLDEETLSRGFEDFMRLGLQNKLSQEDSPLSLSVAVSSNAPCKIDYFVSHCWSDDVDEKVEKLIRFSRHFYNNEGRYPRLWIDLFCVDQEGAEVAQNVKLLPVFLMACDKLLLLKSDTLGTRLWCLTELYTRFVMTAENDSAERVIDVMNLKESSTESFMVDCKVARCSNEEDSILLRERLSRCPGGLSSVNKIIRSAVDTANIVAL